MKSKCSSENLPFIDLKKALNFLGIDSNEFRKEGESTHFFQVIIVTRKRKKIK